MNSPAKKRANRSRSWLTGYDLEVLRKIVSFSEP